MGLPQKLRRLADEHIHRWVVRHGKRGQQLRQRSCASPLVVGENLNRLVVLEELLGAPQDRGGDGCRHAFLQVGEIAVIGTQVERRNEPRLSRGKGLESELCAACERRIAGHDHLQPFHAFFGAVGEPKRAHDRNRVLDRRIAERRVRLQFNADGPGKLLWRLRLCQRLVHVPLPWFSGLRRCCISRRLGRGEARVGKEIGEATGHPGGP